MASATAVRDFQRWASKTSAISMLGPLTGTAGVGRGRELRRKLRGE